MIQEILRLPVVMSRTGLSRAGIYTRMKDGSFPQSVPLGARTVGWISVEVEAWIQDRIEERDNAG